MGRSYGAGEPIYLKCSKCKLQRLNGIARSGNLVRTGRERETKKGGVLRTGNIARECRCLECGHVGWYRHKDAARRPLSIGR